MQSVIYVNQIFLPRPYESINPVIDQETGEVLELNNLLPETED